VAVVVVLACVAGLAYLHRGDLLPAAEDDDAGLNPEFVACRTERLGDIDKMRDDGLIDDAQEEQFAARALAYCTSRFPPEVR